MRLRHLLPLSVLFTLYIIHYTFAAAGGVKPLAQQHIVIGNTSDFTPEPIGLYTPSILRLPSGRLIAYFESSTKLPQSDGKTLTVIGAHIRISDDHGLTWRNITKWENLIQHARLFYANGKTYLFGHKGNLRIASSADDGLTWSDPTPISTSTGWHQSACNVWFAKGNIYLAMERRAAKGITSSWTVGDFAPVLLRASLDSDLLDPASWTFATELPFSSIIPGYDKNDMPSLDYFGIPFFQQNYPGATRLAPGRNFHPMGWLETNVVQITDPNHYWYDPAGKTFHLFMRANTGNTNYAALLKAVENDNGTITTSLEHVPSGKAILFLPLPGGQMRFHILYDQQTKLYWLLSSQPIDSMTLATELPSTRVGLPANERHRMVLHFSKNMVDWCFAGLVAIGGSPQEARHYASMDFDGDDLVILSRSGDAQANSAHDGNLITFHRVKNFRNLIY